MSTRSYIGYIQQDGTAKFAYCHCDGYLKGVGECLMNYYNKSDKVMALVDEGSMSSLGETIYNTDFYGEEPIVVNKKDITNFLNESWAEYAYLWSGLSWFYQEVPFDSNGWRHLKDEFELQTITITTYKLKETSED